MTIEINAWFLIGIAVYICVINGILMLILHNHEINTWKEFYYFTKGTTISWKSDTEPKLGRHYDKAR